MASQYHSSQANHMNRDLYAELFSTSTTEEEILDVASDILTETVELLIDLGIPAEVMKEYIDLVNKDYAS